MVKIIQDDESLSLQNHFAIIHTPKQNRKRFGASTVTVLKNESDALAEHDPDNKRFAAVVYGPSSSSESQKIFYLVKWLEK